ncbi:MAG TPA: FtsX-like permease family protein [Gemmataceae bacterium]|nr:FtsX-like permease family protein [Gemmataceae bacterium]
MTFGRLLRQNLFYHWRGNIAVLLGVAVGTAVLTGALLVGDSLRGSLRDLVGEQLGWVDHALVAGRFFRQDLAVELGAGQVSPAILIQGTASHAAAASDDTGRRRVQQSGRVMILGVDGRFWANGAAPSKSEELWQSARDEVVLNAALAAELGVARGDKVTLHLQKVSAIPRESLLGQRDAADVVDELPLVVHEVIPNEGLGRFNVHPSPAVPRNAYVPMGLLQAKLGQPRRINALFIGGGETAAWQQELKRHLTLEDWGLILHSPGSRTQNLFDKLDRNHDGKLTRNEWRGRVAETFAQAVRDSDDVLERSRIEAFYRSHHNYLSLESRQMLLESAVAESAQRAAKDAGLTTAATLVYLANTISDGKHEIPYSIVAALEPGLPPPLGPFLPSGVDHLEKGDIVLADWKESPLHLEPGQKVQLRYFEPEQEGRLQETTATFRFRGLVPLQGAANDPDLTPEFPGITDKLGIRDWNPPFPYDNRRVQRRDETYWEQFRTTPKAYVLLADGQRLWGSRFGHLTSIRLAVDTVQNGGTSADLMAAANTFRQALPRYLDPEQGGLVFDAVRRRGLDESLGSTDFGGLFLCFSCFLIAAALLLVGLLFRLNLDRRARELGLLVATGYARRTVRRLLLAEGAVLAILGGFLGLAGALLYAERMLAFLTSLWPGFLRLHTTAGSFGIGYGAALVVSVLTIAWAVRVLGKVSPRALLSGETAEASGSAVERRPVRWSRWLSMVTAVLGLACLGLGPLVRDNKMQAMSFFGCGAFLLTASLGMTWTWLRSARHGSLRRQSGLGLAHLGIRNAARHPVRSLLTAGLVASATFLIVAVESFHRAPGQDFFEWGSGSGGFSLLAESDVPIFQDLNSPRGREELNLSPDADRTLSGITVFPLRVRAGEDVSCLNLYQPRRPRLLGVPPRLVERGGFQFKESEAQSEETRSNPWLLLHEPAPDGAIPVFGEANTVEWILHKGMGQELTVPDERGQAVRLRIVGLLQDSVFQSELLMSEANFLKLYPRQEGYGFFLIDAPAERTGAVRSLLETDLANYGFTVTPAAQRLQAYLAVENTYLSTFQALGGLGLLLGAFGLAVVLMRSVWERRGELALLRALGYRQTALGWLMLAENGFLLVLGLGIGAVTAFLAVAPHLLAGSGEVPLLRLLGLLVLVLMIGLTAGAAAVAATVRAPLLAALRRE